MAIERWLMRGLVILGVSLPSAVAPAKVQMRALAADLSASIKLLDGPMRIDAEQFTIRLVDDYRYINAKDTSRILIEAWGNPAQQIADQKPLGMIVPKDFIEQGALWGVVVTASHDGHIIDKDADKIDYDGLLEKMRDDAKFANQERKSAGAALITSIDWATEPHHDSLSHKIYWAKEITFGRSPVPTLNYAVRILGRENTINFNAVGSMDRFAGISAAMQTVLAFSEFDVGYRYQDFNPKYHRVATYGLPGLVAGQMITKLTALKAVLHQLLSSSKLFVAGLSGLAVVLGRFLGRKKPPEA